MTDTLLLGTSAADITPLKPLSLSGFSFRKGNFESVRTSLSLKCFCFRYAQEDVFVFSADILCWGRDTVMNCTELLKRELPGAERSRFLFLATHTHCGPALSYYFASGLGKPDYEYVSMVMEKTVQAAKEASAGIQPARAVLYTGKTAIPVNRRLKTDTGFDMAPNPEGPKNDDIYMIEFIPALDGKPAEAGELSRKGETLAIIVCASCHPTASGDNRVDREFLVRGLDYFMAENAPKALGAFFQGCCGDTRPPLIRDGRFYRGSLDAESEELAKQFAGELRLTREGKGTLLSFNGEHVFIKAAAALPFNADFRHKNRNEYIHLDDEIGEWARHFQDESVPAAMNLEICFFNLAAEFAMLFLSGEIVSEYSLYCKDISNGRVWLGAYANGMTTYIPTAAQLEEGGYEAYDSLFYLLQPAPFGKDAEAVLKKAIAEITGNAHRV
ncbi:hypothetical protein LJC14_06245 [Treponema sp. OttesenSCG-928-L16]|nr:hypothetical protein [Treponema sp. OttesenSCG-928-L16]